MNETHKTCFSDLNINLDKTEEAFITNILTCIFNSVFSLITCVGNFIILHAISKDQDLHSPCFILLYCLAFSDLLVGAICQPFMVAHKIAELVDNFSTYCTLRIIHNISGYITSGVSLLTLAAVSINRLLAVTSFTIQRFCQCSSGVSNRIFSLDLFNCSCYSQVLDESY